MESQHDSFQGNKFHTILINVQSRGSTPGRNQMEEILNDDGGSY
jgi:hypothetical protein